MITQLPPTNHVVMEQTYSREDKSVSPIAIFWDRSTGRPSEPLRKILDLMNIPEGLSLKEIVERTQKEWLRSGERAVAADSPELLAKQALILQYADELQMMRTIEPKQSIFSSVKVLGSKIATFEKRLKSALDRIGSRAISLDVLWILAGERKLDKDEVEQLQAMRYAKEMDERGMMDHIATERVAEYFIERDKHRNSDKCPNTFLLEVAKASKKEGAVRATTEDTLIECKRLDDSFGSSPKLLVSSQPFGLYQLLVSKLALPDEEEHDLLAVETSERRAIIYLDTLARILYIIDKLN